MIIEKTGQPSSFYMKLGTVVSETRVGSSFERQVNPLVTKIREQRK